MFVGGVSPEGGEAAFAKLAGEALLDGELEAGVGRAHSVGAGLGDDRDVHEEIVPFHPGGEQAF
jgi:hypothetical protein